MKFCYDKNLLIRDIEEFIVRGNVYAKGNSIYLDEEELVQASTVSVCALLLMTENKKNHDTANNILENGKFRLCHMTPMHLSRIYINYFDRLTEKAKNNIIAYLKKIKPDYCGDELDFVGVNDNFPLMSTYTASAMYKILDDTDMLGEAERRFSQLECLLKRRGVISEYNSGYTTFQLFIIAALEKIAPNERCRKIALNAQTRIWVDLFAHYHDKIGTICGPFSRWYMNLLEYEDYEWIIETLFKPSVKPAKNYYKPSYRELLYLSEDFYCHDESACLLREKHYPFEFKACAECSASTDSTPECAVRNMETDNETYEYSAGEEKLYTYMTEDYAVGTATKEWHSGVQTSGFNAAYKNCSGVPKEEADIRNIDCRYLINDESVKEQRFFEQGRKTAFGNKNRALVLYKPKISVISAVHNLEEGVLAAHYRRQEITGNIGCTSAKLVILMPLHGKYPDNIIAGEENIFNYTANLKQPQTVYIKDGDVYLAFHPLEITDKGREYAQTIRIRDNKYLEIALYNYAGDAKDFARRDFLHICNGFGFTISSKSECGSFEQFVEHERKTVIVDRMITTMHSRQTYVRHVDMCSEDMKLSCEISPASEGIKYMTCNDYPIEIPKLYLSGFDMKKLPYME